METRPDREMWGGPKRWGTAKEMQRDRKGRDEERAAAGRDRDHGCIGTQKPKKEKIQRDTGEEDDRGMKGDRGDPEGGTAGR